MPDILSAPLVVEFPFTRSLGPVQSAFLTGLRERTVLGVRTGDGKVLVPPVEYDPVTAEEIRDLVEVAATGTVTTWAWNPHPRRDQPLDTPFAWVLVRLDGADTALLHVLDAPGPDAVHTGMRVRVRWAGTRTGAITDIACFEPYEGEPGGSAPHDGEFADPVTGIVTPARLDYTYSPGRAQSAYLEALAGRLRRRGTLPVLPQGVRPAARRLPHLRRRHRRTGRGRAPRHGHHLLRGQHQGQEPRHRSALRLRPHRPGRCGPRAARPDRRHPVRPGADGAAGRTRLVRGKPPPRPLPAHR